MSLPVSALSAVTQVAQTVSGTAGATRGAGAFTGTLQHALVAVSQSQTAAHAAEHAVAADAPGASMATALVLSDKAEVNWNATVAVRNEVVSAYQSIMNMQI